MIGLIVLTFVPALAAIMFWLRARAEQRGRIAAEARLAELRSAAAGEDSDAARLVARRRRLLGVVAHELRSPISAILGYQELLAEGILGPLDERALEATSRIRHSAHQLLNLTDGMYELAHTVGRDGAERAAVPLGDVLADVLRHAEAEGAGRGVNLEARLPGQLPTINTDAERLRRTLDLIIAAAIKPSAGATLTLTADLGDAYVTLHVDGSRIDPLRDVPDPDAPDSFSTGAGLRLAMAQAGAETIGASLSVHAADEATRLTLTLPID